MNSPKVITANFAINEYALMVEALHGTVEKSPDQEIYNHDKETMLTAVAEEGYHFIGWTGSTTSTLNPLMVVMNSTMTLTANFMLNEYPLVVSVQNGSVAQSPERITYGHGSEVTLTATPDEGYHFTGWSGSMSGVDNPLMMTMDTTKSLIANFQINRYEMVILVENGKVDRHPKQALYDHVTTVTLTATPDDGYRFVGWSGSTSSTLTPLSITMDSTQTLTAHFALKEYALVIVADNGSVVKSPSQLLYEHGTTVTLTATPNEGYLFTKWVGDVPAGEEKANPLSLLMDGGRRLTATFSRVRIVPPQWMIW